MTLDYVYSGDLNRRVALRPNTSDAQVFADTFTGLYHTPPAEMPVPATVLDLGANIGLTAAHYRALWPNAHVVAVEMDRACADLAIQNAPGVVVRCHAVSGRGLPGYYDPELRAEAYRFSYGAREGFTATDSLTLHQTIRRAFPDGHCDFLKMDVEGAEWDIFAHDFWAASVSHLLAELHGNADSDVLVAAAVETLDGLGFRTTRHTRHPQAVWAVR